MPIATPTPASFGAATPIALDDSLPIVELRRTANSTDATALIDLDSETTWRSTEDAPSMIYVVADLGKARDVGSITLARRSGRDRRVRCRVEISTDGQTWETMAEPPPGMPGVWQEVVIDQPASAIRIVITNLGHAQSIGGVAELRIQPRRNHRELRGQPWHPLLTREVA